MLEWAVIKCYYVPGTGQTLSMYYWIYNNPIKQIELLSLFYWGTKSLKLDQENVASKRYELGFTPFLSTI